MTLAIMGAMEEEVEPLLERFENVKVTEIADNKYYETTYNGNNIVIAYSKIGKVNAALTATLMIEKFGAEKLIFTGVAGALNPKLKVGDMVVATKLIQHDVDITAFGHPWGFIPESGDFVECDAALVSKAKESAKAIGVDLLDGIIATGDQFIADSKKKDFIVDTYKADATEMEGASVAYVCKCMNVPFVVLRSISDAADMDAGFDFEEFLKSSAKTSADFCLKMLDNL
ncbi:MAG: 5'-methylthioadenosine/adenosylhomocysteine nucleosidase [Campylobacterales bacterium]|nr:5'-methylthioadenosine/adenosylhomocysteine nucleosidase [Campylobacterales bacterium]